MPRIAEINDTRIAYEEAGQGETVVFIHAGIADRRMWAGQMAAFAQHYHCLSYDLRGYGESADPQADFSHHEDLKGLLDHLGVQQAALVGCSMGGMATLDFALAYPERVNRIAMVCSLPTGFDYSGDVPPIWDEIVASSKAGDLDKTNQLEVHMWIVGYGRDADEVDSDLLAFVREMNGQVLRREAEHKGKNQPLEPKAITRLDELTVPLLAVVGQYDDPEFSTGWDGLLDRLPDAKKVTLAAGHLPNLEVPDDFNRALKDFLAK